MTSQKGYFARLLDVPCNRLKKLPHLGPELPSPLESFFSKGTILLLASARPDLPNFPRIRAPSCNISGIQALS